MAEFANQYVESGGFAYGTNDLWNQFVYVGGVAESVSATSGASFNGDQYVSGGQTYYTYLSARAAANTSIAAETAMAPTSRRACFEYVYAGGIDSAVYIDDGGKQ